MSHPFEFTGSKIDRRGFIKAGAATAASLLLPISSNIFAAMLSQDEEPPTEHEVNDWIWVGRNHKIVLGVSQVEVGQGIYTGLAEVIAAEMDADWSKVTVQFVTNRDAYKQVAGGESKAQYVAASTSMTNFYVRMRLAGAQARELFLLAGANKLGVKVSDCYTENSQVFHRSTQRSLTYGELIDEVPKFTPNPQPRLKTPKEEKRTMIGHQVGRVDSPGKVNGTAKFGIDVVVPKMLIGVPWIVPSETGFIKTIRNEAEIQKMPGVVGVVLSRHMSTLNLVRLDNDFRPNTVIIVARSYWQAKKAADQLDVDFDAAKGKGVSTASIDKQNREMLEDGALVTATARGGKVKDLIATSRQSTRYHAARYASPYVTHATMEPCNATVHFQDDKITAWGPFQGQDMVRLVLGGKFNVSPANVTVHTTYIGGSFGRKYTPDAAVHACTASKALGRPVKVIYPREVDTQHGYMRPAVVSHYQAVLGDDGYPQALWVRHVGQSLFWQIRRDAIEKAGGWDETVVECVYNTRYTIPNLLVEAGMIEQPLTLTYLRGVGTSASLFFYESFISELASKAKIDEYLYRRRLLANDKLAIRTLDAAAGAANWNSPLPEGHFHGMAFNIWVGRNDAFTTYVALVLEILKTENSYKIINATVAIDCGKIINPNLIRCNMEGGIGFALTGATKSRLDFNDGAIVQSNFFDYPLINIAEMPVVKTVILESDRPPQGCGEVSTGVVAPALASALAKAFGKEFRDLPIKI